MLLYWWNLNVKQLFITRLVHLACLNFYARYWSWEIRPIDSMRENVIGNAKNAHVHGRATKIIEKVLYAHGRKTSPGRTKWIMHNCNICLNADNEDRERTGETSFHVPYRGLFDRRNPRDSSRESSRAKSRDDTMFCDRDRHSVHDDVACDN